MEYVFRLFIMIFHTHIYACGDDAHNGWNWLEHILECIETIWCLFLIYLCENFRCAIESQIIKFSGVRSALIEIYLEILTTNAPTSFSSYPKRLYTYSKSNHIRNSIFRHTRNYYSMY